MSAAVRDRRGMSLLEVLIALAVLSLTAGVVATRAAVAVDQMETHAAFQAFQTQLSTLRARAFAEQVALTAAAPSDKAGEDSATVLPLRPSWTLRVDSPLVAGADGVCAATPVLLVRGGRVKATLAPVDRACHYARHA